MSTRKSISSRKIQLLNAQTNDNDDDTGNNNGTQAGQQQQQGNDNQMTPATYAYFWTLPFTVTLQNWIALVSIVLLLLDAIVVAMFILRLIPIVPPSFLYYGFVWYLLFILTGWLTLIVSFSINKFMYRIVFVLLCVALVVIVFLNYVIVYQIVQCYRGVSSDPMCPDLYLTQLVLLGVSFGIGVCIFALTILFFVMVMRIAQSNSAEEDY